MEGNTQNFLVLRPLTILDIVQSDNVVTPIPTSTLPLDFCEMCQVESSDNIVTCGHEFCTNCLSKLMCYGESLVFHCPLCRGLCIALGFDNKWQFN